MRDLLLKLSGDIKGFSSKGGGGGGGGGEALRKSC